jgi:hypothetical protein
MRLITPRGDQSPTRVYKHLLPHEEHVVTIRRHPVVLAPWAAAAAGGLLIAISLAAMPRASQPEQTAAWLLTGFLLIEFLLAAARWQAWYLVVTTQRMLICSGVSSEKAAMWPLTALTGMTYERSSGQLLSGLIGDYGRLIIQGRTFLDYLPYPEQLYLEICGLIFPAKFS